jgi:hypothetical protein
VDKLSKIIYELESKADWIKSELESIVDEINNTLMIQDDAETLIETLGDVKAQLENIIYEI